MAQYLVELVYKIVFLKTNMKEKIMAFCKYSTQLTHNDSITLDQSFVTNFMPSAPESCVKIYLYGLCKCNNPNVENNSIEDFCDTLGYSQEDIMSAFYYWQDLNLVQILNVTPFEIRYLPIRNSLGALKKYKVDKYASFNMTVQELLEDRMITPNEYNEYYSIIESLRIEPDALIMIIKYCIDSKGKNINYPYIITVAKNWAYEGVHTTEEVESKIASLNATSSELAQILKALGSKANISLEQRNNYIKWTKDYGYELGTILYVAKAVKSSSSRYSFDDLDKLLTQYYGLGLFGIKEIEEYNSNKQYLEELARKILKCIGLQYSNVESMINTYLIEWMKKGYSEQTLIEIAEYCYKSSKRTLADIDRTIGKLYKLGLLSSSSIAKYIGGVVVFDNKIQELIDNLGLDRKVNKFDREYYKTWTDSWGFDEDTITYAGSISVDKSSPIQYMNKILSSWHDSGIKTLAQAKSSNKTSSAPVVTKSQNTNSFVGRSYSQDELNALFDNLDEVNL